MKHKLLICCLLALTVRPCWVAAQEEQELVAPTLQGTLNNACQVAAPPGAVLALSMPGSETQLLSWGVANRADGTAIRATEPMPIGSITKLFTAVVVLQLAEEGVIGLDDPLSSYYPELPATDGITIRMLLNHSSGIYDYAELQQDAPLPLVALAITQRWQPYDVVRGAMQLERYFAPGAGFHYSNTNYFLLGLIVEQVTGNEVGEEYRTRVYQPLGLSSTYLAGHDPLPASAMRGYLYRNGTYQDTTGWENASLAWTAGGLVSNTEDLMRFATALFGGELLSDWALSEMFTTVQRPRFGHYGLGLMDVQAEGVRFVGHGGGTLAFRTGLWHIPEHDITLVTLTNLANCEIWVINEAVLRWALIQVDSQS